MPTSILITGGNGFIGSGLINALASNSDFSIKGSVRSNGGAHFPASVQTLQNLDVDSDAGWLEAFLGVDYVIHCAARYHIKNESSGDLLAICRKVNVDGTMRLARLAAQAGVKRFIFMSSLKVNGEFSDPGRPFLETDTPTPFYPYGISKLEAENALLQFSASSKMDVVIIRPPPVYGPGVKANFLAMMRFLDYCLPLPLGGIKNLRSYIGLANLVSFVELCVKHPGASNQIFFVSDDDDLSTSRLLKMMSAALGKLSLLVPAPKKFLTFLANMVGRQYIPELLFGNFQADISKAKHLLGWMPPESVQIGMKKTALHYLSNKT
jgi:nucleoside-diphosphate-sugar epimerase